MPTYWHKRDWWPSDLDRTNPHMPSIVPGALTPGIYCEDEAAFRALLRGARTRGATFNPGIHSGLARIDGMAVYVATPEQARLLQAISSKEEPPPVSEPSYEEVVAEQVAAERKAARATMLEVWKAWLATNPPEAPRPERHPVRKANRAQRRAAEAKRRRA